MIVFFKPKRITFQNTYFLHVYCEFFKQHTHYVYPKYKFCNIIGSQKYFFSDRMCGGFTCSKNTLVGLNIAYILVSFIMIGVAVHGQSVIFFFFMSTPNIMTKIAPNCDNISPVL